MKKLIKENFVLLMGILLPVVLIIAFSISNKLSTLNVEKTKYDFLFSTKGYSNSRANPEKLQVRFIVKDNQLYARVSKPKNSYNQNTTLYRYNSAEDDIEELDFEFTTEMEKMEEGDKKDYLVESTQDLKLRKSAVSEDGYRYQYSYGRGRGLMGGIFGFGYNSRQRHSIEKSRNSRYPILINNNFPYKHSKLDFISWVKNNE